MLERYPILACVLACLMAGYLCFALPATGHMAAESPYSRLRITVDDPGHTGFVTAADIDAEGGDIASWLPSTPRRAVDLADLERRLSASDKVEDINVHILNDGTLAIDVRPMVPVARIYDGAGPYYINTEGKRITAHPRYHVDVPVVMGAFDERHPAVRLLPMLTYIASVPELDALVSTLSQSPSGDIILVPAVRGHVVNFGDTSAVVDKFSRLLAFYRQVMPVRGWQTYDTVAVKWRGQVVATRRERTLPQTTIGTGEEHYDEADDLDTMLSPEHFRNDSTELGAGTPNT